MAELQRIPDHVQAGLALLMSQYVGAPNVQKLLTAFLTHNQHIEDALFGLYKGRLLTDADTAGQTLDNIGSLIGIARNGLDDATYRVLLYAKIAENAGDATLDTLVRVTQALFSAQAVFEKTPNSLARSGQYRGAYVALMVGTPGVPATLYPLIQRLLTQSLPGGVELAHLGTFNAPKAFAFAGNQPWVGGWGDIHDPTVGAPFASLLSNSSY